MTSAPLKLATSTRKGFSACCIRGGCPGVMVSLDNADAFTCTACDETFSGQDVQRFLGQWSAVLAWCAQAPPLGGTGGESNRNASTGH
jgi:hypothetical protein